MAPLPAEPPVVASRSPFKPHELILWSLALAGLSWCLVVALRHPFEPGANTFSAFYYAALAVRNGTSILAASKDYIYPPLMAWAFQPLTYLPVGTAYRVWLMLSLLLTSSSMFIGVRAFTRAMGAQPQWRAGITAIAFAFLLSLGEAKTAWSVAQCDGLVLDAFAFAFALLTRSPVLAGLTIALGANIKYQTLILVPYLLWRRHFKVVAGTGFGMIIFGLMPMLSLGWQGNRDAWTSALGGLGRFIGLHSNQAADVHSLDWGSSISITSAIARCVRDLNGSPVLLAALLLLVLTAVATAIVCIYKRYQLPLKGALDHGVQHTAILVAVEWCIVLAALLAFGPQTTRRHLFVLMLFHLFIAVWLLAPSMITRGRSLFISSLIAFQLALRLPPSAAWCQPASDAWKYIGGPSWLLIALCLAMLITAGQQVTSSNVKQRAGLRLKADF